MKQNINQTGHTDIQVIPTAVWPVDEYILAIRDRPERCKLHV